MRTSIHPTPAEWPALLQRPMLDTTQLEGIVAGVLREIEMEGDRAVQKYTEKYDGCKLEDLRVSDAEKTEAARLLSAEVKDAIAVAKKNILRFHESQRETPTRIATMPGVECWRKSVGIEKVGLYIPGGTAPLFSSVLMLGVPATLAGCREIILCSPPNDRGALHPAIIYTATQVGIDQIYKVGGIQAIGAMAYGTETIPAVYKIFGPGNQYVTAAKQLVNRDGVAIDMPAGPSEVLVCADDTAEPAFVAADLLSQAEHGVDSQVVLVAFSEQMVRAVKAAIEIQLQALPRRRIAAQALDHSAAIVVASRAEAVALINTYAPEHLILSVAEAETMAEDIINAGSVFLGNYSPESVGDYAAGTNHTLPTNGHARAYSGVSLDSFVKKITYQRLTKAGLANIGPAVEVLAEAEDLMAHRNAVRIRLQNPPAQ